MNKTKIRFDKSGKVWVSLYILSCIHLFTLQCTLGCSLWDLALDSSCQKVCVSNLIKFIIFLGYFLHENFIFSLQNKSEINDFDNRQIFCVKGCIEASNFYFEFMQEEFPSLLAPALVPDSLTSTTLSLEWSVPERFLELSRGKRKNSRKFFVQCLEESEGDWKICGQQTIFANSTVHLEQLQPYTKYKVNTQSSAIYLYKQ